MDHTTGTTQKEEMKMIEKNNTTFHEKQRLRQVWIWILMIFPTIIVWYIAIQELLFNNPVGNSNASNQMIFVFWLGFGILFPLFFYKLKLITSVRQDGVYVRFVPFHFSF